MAEGLTRRPRPAPPGVGSEEEIAAMIRVDHAGELGAVRIYEGQLAVLGKVRTATAETLRHMAQQEEEHLAAFDALLAERQVEPTVLLPLWRLAGYALGAATALMGEKAAMACTEAVETVIDTHYAGQIERLGGRDPELSEKIAKFRADEIAHRDTATAHGAAEAPAYRLLTDVIKTGCRAAIALSTRI